MPVGGDSSVTQSGRIPKFRGNSPSSPLSRLSQSRFVLDSAAEVGRSIAAGRILGSTAPIDAAEENNSSRGRVPASPTTSLK